jgi:hypothetical protein
MYNLFYIIIIIIILNNNNSVFARSIYTELFERKKNKAKERGERRKNIYIKRHIIYYHIRLCMNGKL